MNVVVERKPNPEPPVSGVVITLSRDEAQALYEIANWSAPVSELVAARLYSSHQHELKEVLHTIWSHLVKNGFNCRRGR